MKDAISLQPAKVFSPGLRAGVFGKKGYMCPRLLILHCFVG